MFQLKNFLVAFLAIASIAGRNVRADDARPDQSLHAVHFQSIQVDGFWKGQLDRMTVKWIPHCIKQMEAGGEGEELLNLVNTGKALRGQPHGEFTGLPWSDAYVFNTVESICLALEIDPGDDKQLAIAQDKLRDKLEEWIPILLAAQCDDGYIHSFHILNDHTRYSNIGWHEFYVQGYFIEMGVAHRRMTGGRDNRLYDAARACADHLVANFGPQSDRRWFHGHAGMGYALCRLARLVDEVEPGTGGEKYYQLAKHLLDERYEFPEYRNPYHQSHRPVTEMTDAVGHAVRATYFYTAMADLAMLTGDEGYRTAVDRIWEDAIDRKHYLTGGVGASHQGEAFADDFDLRNDGYCESCAGCGMSFWADRMFRMHHDASHIDVQERTLYNNLLGAIELSGENFFYQNPLASRTARYSWHVCPCCVGNIPRTLLGMKDLIYAVNSDRNQLYVNHFVGSDGVIQDIAGTSLRIRQVTEYPWKGHVKIVLEPQTATEFTLKVRIPDRTESGLYQAEPDLGGQYTLHVNGQEVSAPITNGYVDVQRRWQSGDVVELTVPVEIQRMRTDDRVVADRGRVALTRGPIVYNIENVDHQTDVRDLVLPADAPLSASWHPDLLGGVMAIEAPAVTYTHEGPKTEKLIAIPNYTRLNRGDWSQVWITESREQTVSADQESDAAQQTAEIQIDCDQPTVTLSPHLYGLFFEDINYAADGGLYAELVQNRSFEYHSLKEWIEDNDFYPMYAWQGILRAGGQAAIEVANSNPIHENNQNYLRLDIGRAGVVGVRNAGFDGIHLDEGAAYGVSLYARTENWIGDGSITVTLESADGDACGSVVLNGAQGSWQKLAGVIKATKSVDHANLVVTTTGQGVLNLDMISLFPQETFNGRKNGLRKDLVQALKDLNPKFLRFPGGCIAHGWGLDNMYRWKDTVGDVASRKPNWNLWGYHQTYGLGYFEYFQLCEDLEMAALPVIPVGIGCGFRCNEFVPIDELGPYIQDAIDLVEFANGPVTSRWGAVRAEMGHPEPFNLQYICLGNEEHDTPGMRERFPLFVKALREAHPEIKIIGTSGLGDEIPLYDLMTREQVYSSDEHYYMSPDWFLSNQNRFDEFDRSLPKIFVGEYAAHDRGRRNTLYSALSEAAFLVGVERNADMVDMTCYAPLFGRDGHSQWNPDLIYFDKRNVVRTTNYYVQQLFGQNKGDVFLNNRFEVNSSEKPMSLSGHVGIGTWNTAIEVAEISVNGRKLDPVDWKVLSGDFQMVDGKYVQSNHRVAPAMSLSKEAFSGESITFEVRARKTRGVEGFLLRFAADQEGRDGFWWNVAGWNNDRHGLEQFTGGQTNTVASTDGSIETGRWYDLKVELTAELIRCYLDNKLVQEYSTHRPSLSVSSTYDRAAGDVIVKLVNPSSTAIDATVKLGGLKSVADSARVTSLSGGKDDANTIRRPNAVVPLQREVSAGSEFEHRIPGYSVQVLRIKAQL